MLCQCHSEPFESIDTLTFQVRYDMPSKGEVNLLAGKTTKQNPLQTEADFFVLMMTFSSPRKVVAKR